MVSPSLLRIRHCQELNFTRLGKEIRECIMALRVPRSETEADLVAKTAEPVQMAPLESPNWPTREPH